MQHHSSKYFASWPHQTPINPTLGMGSKIQNSTFFRTCSCCISNWRESRMWRHGSQYFNADPTTLGDRVKRSNVTFFGTWLSAYQIKRNHECSIIVANILPADPTKPPSTRTWGWGQKFKIQLFSEHVLVEYQIEGNHGYSNMVTDTATW